MQKQNKITIYSKWYMRPLQWIKMSIALIALTALTLATILYTLNFEWPECNEGWLRYYDIAFIKPIASQISHHKLISKNLFAKLDRDWGPSDFSFLCVFRIPAQFIWFVCMFVPFAFWLFASVTSIRFIVIIMNVQNATVFPPVKHYENPTTMLLWIENEYIPIAKEKKSIHIQAKPLLLKRVNENQS